METATDNTHEISMGPSVMVWCCVFQIPCLGPFMIHPHLLDPQIMVLPKTIATSQGEKNAKALG